MALAGGESQFRGVGGPLLGIEAWATTADNAYAVLVLKQVTCGTAPPEGLPIIDLAHNPHGHALLNVATAAFTKGVDLFIVYETLSNGRPNVVRVNAPLSAVGSMCEGAANPSKFPRFSDPALERPEVNGELLS